MSSDIIMTPYGPMPARYKCVKLADVCAETGGVQTGPFGSQLHQRDYVSSGTPIITVEHLGDNRIIHQDLPRVSDKDRQRLSRYSLKHGDIVFSRVGSVDLRALVRKQEEGWLFSGRCLRVRPKSELVDPGYLSWFFGLPAFRQYVRSIAFGATMPSLNTKLLSELPIYFPELPDQHAIANILGTLDDKIELNRQMNQTLEAMAQALFKNWFVDFEPFRDQGMQDSPLGEIPKGWRVGRLDEMAVVNQQSITRDYPYNTIEYIDISSVNRGRLEGTTIYSLTDAPSRAKRLVKDGDTIWSTVRPNRKSYLLILSPKDNLVVSTGFAVLTPYLVPPSFLYLVVTTEEFVEYLAYSADGSAYPAVRPDRFAEAEILIPPNNILRDFELRAIGLFRKMKANDDESYTLGAIRDVLLPKLLSGEIRLKDAEKFVEEAA